MKIVIRIVAVLAAIVGIMAVVAGSRVLFGFSVPDYQYFTSLIVYNVFMGAASVIAGVIIWQGNNKSLLFASIISSFHIIVLLLLLTVFSDVISGHSINAMTFRSVAWVIFSIIIWKGNSILKSSIKTI